MKGLILFLILTVAVILGHDIWSAHDKDLPFALSDFGWMINTYVPSVETWLADTFSPDDQARYITPIFKTETIWVACTLVGILILLNLVFNFKSVAEELSDMKLNPFKKSYSAESVFKRDSKKKIKYKRK